MPTERSLPFIKEEDTDTSGNPDCTAAKTGRLRPGSSTAQIPNGNIAAGLTRRRTSLIPYAALPAFWLRKIRASRGSTKPLCRQLTCVSLLEAASCPTLEAPRHPQGGTKEKVSGDGTMTTQPAGRDQAEQGAFSHLSCSFWSISAPGAWHGFRYADWSLAVSYDALAHRGSIWAVRMEWSILTWLRWPDLSLTPIAQHSL